MVRLLLPLILFASIIGVLLRLAGMLLFSLPVVRGGHQAERDDGPSAGAGEPGLLDASRKCATCGAFIVDGESGCARADCPVARR